MLLIPDHRVLVEERSSYSDGDPGLLAGRCRLRYNDSKENVTYAPRLGISCSNPSLYANSWLS